MFTNDAALNILMGDWDFVMEAEDRLCLRTMHLTGRADKPFAGNFHILLDAHQFREPLANLSNWLSTAQSRIDRIYTNRHVSDQLDRQLSAHFSAPGIPLASRLCLLRSPTSHKRTTQRRHNFLRTSCAKSSGNATYISTTTKNYHTTPTHTSHYVASNFSSNPCGTALLPYKNDTTTSQLDRGQAIMDDDFHTSSTNNQYTTDGSDRFGEKRSFSANRRS